MKGCSIALLASLATLLVTSTHGLPVEKRSDSSLRETLQLLKDYLKEKNSGLKEEGGVHAWKKEVTDENVVPFSSDTVTVPSGMENRGLTGPYINVNNRYQVHEADKLTRKQRVVNLLSAVLDYIKGDK